MKSITLKNLKSKVAKSVARIKKSNDRFASLSAIGKRKAIARDVLARLKTTQLIPAHLGWVHPKTKDGCIVDFGSNLQTLLKDNVECRVCALGAAICGLAHFENKIQVGEISVFTGGKLDARLEEIFGLEQLRMIEYAYEGGGGAISSLEIPDDNLRRKLRIYEDEMEKIFTMIAKDKEGKFRP